MMWASALMIGLIQPLVSNGVEMFQLSWKGTVHYTDGAGNLVSKSFTEKDVVRVLAQERGLDPDDLVLVYRPDAFDTAVVFKNAEAMARAGSGQQMVSDYQQIPDVTQPDQRTDVTSADGTQTVRQSFLFDEDHGIAGGLQIGSIFGTEKQKR